MEYRVLAPHLHTTADAALRFFVAELGAKAANIDVEAGLHDAVEFRPTLKLLADDKHIICIEILESLYPPEIKDFILSCRNHSLPVKLYCVIPTGPEQKVVDLKAIQFASENGIGIVAIDPATGAAKYVNGAPISQSLGGLRPFKLTDYPPPYRPNLQSAIQTFKGGSPAKGCLEVYQELEQLTRNIGARAEKIAGGLKKAPGFNWDTVAWAQATEFLKSNLDIAVCKCPELKAQLLSRILGQTEFRNATGHKPKSLSQLIARDRLAKTRFESAMDDLLSLIHASKPLRIKVG